MAAFARCPCMSAIHITDIEAAINHWHACAPSPDGVALAPELRALRFTRYAERGARQGATG